MVKYDLSVNPLAEDMKRTQAALARDKFKAERRRKLEARRIMSFVVKAKKEIEDIEARKVQLAIDNARQAIASIKAAERARVSAVVHQAWGLVVGDKATHEHALCRLQAQYPTVSPDMLAVCARVLVKKTATVESEFYSRDLVLLHALMSDSFIARPL